jgi:hypothetical protein
MTSESARAITRKQGDHDVRLVPVEAPRTDQQASPATADALAQLPAEDWTVYHDVRWADRRYAAIDHVVLGPPGIFVITTQSWPGRITVGQGQVRQNGIAREAAVTEATAAAEALATMVTTVDGRHVHPVLCFHRDEWLTGRADDVLVCSSSNLGTMLLGRPARLREDEIRAAGRQLESGFREASAKAAAPVVRASRHRERVRRPVRLFLRPDALVTGLLLGFALIALILPELVEGLAGWLMGLL